MGLKSFPLLSGGKGIHVVAPIRPEAEWETVREFTRLFATALAQTDPKRFTVALPKKERRGKIFLDFLRNQIADVEALLERLKSRELQRSGIADQSLPRIA